jgi:hypothetical protein
MAKYDPLRRHLEAIPIGVSEVTLSFQQVESIIGRALPPSARRLSQWWENPRSHTRHVQARAWMAAGWRVAGVKLGDGESGWVRFVRGR